MSPLVPWWSAIAGCHVGCHSWVPCWVAIAAVNLPIVPRIYSDSLVADVYLDMFPFAAGIVLGLFGLNKDLELWASVQRKKRDRAC